jgi:hypothetical protein
MRYLTSILCWFVAGRLKWGVAEKGFGQPVYFGSTVPVTGTDNLGKSGSLVSIEPKPALITVALRTPFGGQLQERHVRRNLNLELGRVVAIDHQNLGQLSGQVRIPFDLTDPETSEEEGLGERVHLFPDGCVHRNAKNGGAGEVRLERDILALLSGRPFALQRDREAITPPWLEGLDAGGEPFARIFDFLDFQGLGLVIDDLNGTFLDLASCSHDEDGRQGLVLDALYRKCGDRDLRLEWRTRENRPQKSGDSDEAKKRRRHRKTDRAGPGKSGPRSTSG